MAVLHAGYVPFLNQSLSGVHRDFLGSADSMASGVARTGIMARTPLSDLRS